VKAAPHDRKLATSKSVLLPETITFEGDDRMDRLLPPRYPMEEVPQDRRHTASRCTLDMSRLPANNPPPDMDRDDTGRPRTSKQLKLLATGRRVSTEFSLTVSPHRSRTKMKRSGGKSVSVKSQWRSHLTGADIAVQLM
jgi:hypothetical protein